MQYHLSHSYGFSPQLFLNAFLTYEIMHSKRTLMTNKEQGHCNENFEKFALKMLIPTEKQSLYFDLSELFLSCPPISSPMEFQILMIK